MLSIATAALSFVPNAGVRLPVLPVRAPYGPSMLMDSGAFQLLADAADSAAILMPDAGQAAAAATQQAAEDPGLFGTCVTCANSLPSGRPRVVERALT